MPDGLSLLDLSIVAAYMVFALGVGMVFRREASRSTESFFVGDRRLAWWVAGTSMVATTFAADTPLLVTGIVATDGISGNWIWWAVAIAHLTAAFFFAGMWRRSGVITDAEIIEIRYSGRPAAFLRATKAIYFGLFINCLTMAWVIAAMVKISRAFFDVEPSLVIAICVSVSVGYTLLGGFRSVVVTDLVQFALSAGGAILLAVLLVSQFGGLGSVTSESAQGHGLMGAVEEAVARNTERSLSDVLDIVPPTDHPTLPPIFFLTLLIAGWWRWAEGTGYLVQRMAACRDEANAEGAMIWFAVVHNAVRPWPWILIGLASLVIFPQLPGSSGSAIEVSIDSETGSGKSFRVEPAELDQATGGTLQLWGVASGCKAQIEQQTVDVMSDDTQTFSAQFDGFPSSGIYDLRVNCPGSALAGPSLVTIPGIRVELLDREMAYPLIMREVLPTGLLGLVVASLLAAFMSTIDTHVNWGASYLVQDIYRRFMKPHERPEHYVAVSRVSVVLIAIVAGFAALGIQNIASVWRFLVAIGAGLGSVSALRWFWPRVTAYAELAAMAVTTLLAVAFEVFGTETLFGSPNSFFVLAIPAWTKILLIALTSLCVWVPVAILGPRNDEATLRRFANLVRPPCRTWAKWSDRPPESITGAVVRFAASLFVLFGSLVGIGDLILGRPERGITLLLIALALLAWIIRRRSEAVDPTHGG